MKKSLIDMSLPSYFSFSTELELLYEDNHIIAINKKSSDLSQRDKSHDISLIEKVKSYLKKRYNKKNEAFLGLIHRLDRPVSGVMLFAKTTKALGRFSELLRRREMKKTYWAMVKNRPIKTSDCLVHYLIKNEKQNKSFCSIHQKKGTKEAILDYKLVKSLDHYHLLEINLHSGRHHQIRAQLSFIGSPIKGDIKYGAKRANANLGIHLHARKIEFVHPIKKENISIEAPLPKDPLWNLCNHPSLEKEIIKNKYAYENIHDKKSSI